MRAPLGLRAAIPRQSTKAIARCLRRGENCCHGSVPANPSRPSPMRKSARKANPIAYPPCKLAHKSIRVPVEESMVLQHQLPGAKMPPDVGIGYSSRGHGEEAKRDNHGEHTASLQEHGHGAAKQRFLIESLL